MVETTDAINTMKAIEEKPLFQLLFLRNDMNQSVEIVEAEEIDFEEVRKSIELGESFFITWKPKSKSRNSEKTQVTTDSWYFTHI